ncbi:MAG TPA: glycosyltransferase family 39 protein [Bryobacterales bacterium]|nr:glycosyltransferase family 39 protein [Bryobacterales bacterium]
MNTERQWRAVLLAALLVAFIGRIVATYHVFNDTFDESDHITAGLEILERGRYTIEAQHPPLSRLVLAVLPYYFAGLRSGHYNDLWGHGPWASRDLAFYWKSLSLARTGNLVFALMLFCFVYLWAACLYGPWGGVAACALAVCCPNLIAHAGLATVDMAAAATILMSAYFFWRWCEQPSLAYCVLSAVALALAVLSKLSTLLFLPPLGLLYFLLGRGSRLSSVTGRGFRMALRRAAVFGLLVFMIVWAGYLFEVGTLVPPGHRYQSPFGMHGGSGLAATLVRSLGTRKLPAFRLLQGVLEVATHNSSGQRCYLLGRIYWHGSWLYFPVAILVKSTLPMLLLAAGGAALFIFGCGLVSRRTIYPLSAAALILMLSMPAAINIGVRHVLAIYPFFAILGSALFTTGRRWITLAALALCAWHAGESIAAHPDYLAYFNEIARGREEQFLIDSNLDWGQDLARLGQYVRARRIDSIYLTYFGRTDPAKMGIAAIQLGDQRPDQGCAAVSVTRLIMDSNLAWLRERKPMGRVGKSIWLYDFSR